MAFANTALTISDKVSTVGWIYFAGYMTEAVASVTLGSKIDAWGPLRAMMIFSGLASVVLAVAGFLNVALGVTSIIFVVLTAALIDYINQLVGIAHEASLPEAFGSDESGLIKFSGLDASVRSVASTVAPVIAGFIILQAPGFQSLFVVSVLYATGYVLLIAFLIRIGRRRSALLARRSEPTTGADASPPSIQDASNHAIDPLPSGAPLLPGVHPPQADESSLEMDSSSAARSTLRVVSRQIYASRPWRTFLIVDVLATMALSTVLLLMYSLFRHDFDMAPPAAGVLLGCLAVGSLVAALFIARGTKDGLSRLFGAGSVCSGAGVALLALCGGNLVIGGTGAVILGFGSVLQLKSMTLLVQLNAPRGRIGSWFAVIDAVERVVNAVAIIAAATLMDLLGGEWVFGVAGVILVLCGVWWLSIQRRVWQGADQMQADPVNA